MKKKQKIILVGIMATLTMLCSTGAKAQLNYFQIMDEMALIQHSFNTDSGTYASCAVGYYYSKQSSSVVLDSLFGVYKLKGKAQYIKIANTESIRNDTVSITVYNDDSTLMAGPMPDIVNTEEAFSVNRFDSAFVADNITGAFLTVLNGVKTLSFQFTDSSKYFSCKLTYDSLGGVPLGLTYVLRSSKLSDTGELTTDGDVITIRFTLFSRAAFDTTILSVNKYITIGTDGKATPQPAYSSYNFVQTGDFPVSGN